MEQDTGIVTGSPIYEQLAKRIRRSIHQGDYQAGQLLGSEYELARQENISRMTVRRASELLIKEGLVERRPGKGLYVRGNGNATRLVQVVAGNLAWEPWLQVSRGAQLVAKQKGIQIQLYDAQGDEELDINILKNLIDGPAKGAIIISLHNATFTEAIYQLKLSGFPFVLVDQRLRDIDVPSVTADNYRGGYEVGQELVQLGHQRIAFVGDLVATTVQDRLAGLRDAMADAGLPFDRSLVVNLQAEVDRLGDWSGRIDVSTRELMNRAAPPTAIFFSCDGVAGPACRTLQAMGIRIPQDVSVVGFDDAPVAQWLTPMLTTVHQPFPEMGLAAIELLCLRMENPHAPVEHRVLPVQLIRRGSTAAPRSEATVVDSGSVVHNAQP